jgi:hypothetical protein
MPDVAATAEKIFICYRRGDTAAITGRLYDRLTAKYGKPRIFRDVFSINLGHNFDKVIRDALEKTAVLLVVMGDGWDVSRLAKADDPVRKEIEQALALKVRTIPLFVRGMKMPASSELPPSIEEFCRCNGMPLRDDPDFDNDCERLIESIDGGAGDQPTAELEAAPFMASRSAKSKERAAPAVKQILPPPAARDLDSKGWLLALALGVLAAVAGILSPRMFDLDRTVAQALLSSGCACAVWGVLRMTGGERWLPGGPPMAAILAFVGALLSLPVLLL